MSRRIPVCFSLLFVLLVSLCACRAGSATSPEPSSPARALLARSLRHHDPDSLWGRKRIPLHWTSTKPDGSVSFAVDVELAPNGDFSMRGERKGHELEYRVEGDVVRARADGQDEISAEVEAELLLARDGGLFWRDYLGFLAGLPMCLGYAGIDIKPEVLETALEQRAALSIRVSFAPDVGSDVWTFYFEPDTAELIGCRFDREDPTRDGETIVFEGSVSVAGLRLPRTRRWYMNSDWRFLGTDEVR